MDFILYEVDGAVGTITINPSKGIECFEQPGVGRAECYIRCS